MKRQRNKRQKKAWTRNTEVQINEEEIGKLPEKEFRIMTVKMMKKLENKMEKMLESINKDIEEIKCWVGISTSRNQDCREKYQ